METFSVIPPQPQTQPVSDKELFTAWVKTAEILAKSEELGPAYRRIAKSIVDASEQAKKILAQGAKPRKQQRNEGKRKRQGRK